MYSVLRRRQLRREARNHPEYEAKYLGKEPFLLQHISDIEVPFYLIARQEPLKQQLQPIYTRIRRIDEARQQAIAQLPEDFCTELSGPIGAIRVSIRQVLVWFHSAKARSPAKPKNRLVHLLPVLQTIAAASNHQPIPPQHPWIESLAQPDRS